MHAPTEQPGFHDRRTDRDRASAGLPEGREHLRHGGRAVTHLEEIDRGQRMAIIVDEIPYQVNKRTLLERIAELVNEKKTEGISRIRDESDKSGMRVLVEPK